IRTRWCTFACTPTAADENSEHAVTVHSGDYLSKIAEEELGDGDQWPELFAASKDTPQPHGLPPHHRPGRHPPRTAGHRARRPT
ncbi:hypothetical protein JYK17_35700, partial [Streptomyces sp. KC 17012]|uniref:LysM peptidoglycan-binding domain-containing protein n=1 Tax=Streptomyces plumbidurans TaxID=2814589 RepID=UPI003556D900|nr:hypothetical protein [Streptomyces plumbidurans]